MPCVLISSFFSFAAVLFEYDKRFATFGEDFVFYDYKSPLAVPKELGSR